MPLLQNLREHIAAAFTGLWVQTHEVEEALREIGSLCHEQKWAVATWDIDQGLRIAGAGDPAASDPVAAIKSVNSLATPDGTAVLVLVHFHRFLHSTEVIQALAHQIQQGKSNRTFVLILSPLVQIPIELQTQFVVIEHELPDRKQLQDIAAGIATEMDEMPNGEELEKLLDAAAGLTRFEAEGAFSLSLVREAIPEAVRHEVWRRDQGQCVECGSRERLEFDHLIPVSKGGSSTVRNLRLLCERCNRRKGGDI